MVFRETPLSGAYVIEVAKIADDRGFFGRAWCSQEMERVGLEPRIAQINVSLSRKRGTLRGLHFQIEPFAECKMIRCTRGAIFDVIVDLRPESPTFKGWFGIELTADNYLSLYSPRGFAQGFLTLEENSEIVYSTSQSYAPGKDRGVRYDDPQFGIRLPIDPVVISDKDRSWPDFSLECLK